MGMLYKSLAFADVNEHTFSNDSAIFSSWNGLLAVKDRRRFCGDTVALDAVTWEG